MANLKNQKLERQNFHEQISIRSKQIPLKATVNYITSYQQLHNQVYDSSYDSDSDDYVAAISSDTANQLQLLNAKILY